MPKALNMWRDRITVRVRKLPGRAEWRCTVTYPKHKADQFWGGRHFDASTAKDAVIGALGYLQKRLIHRVKFRIPRRSRGAETSTTTPLASGN